MVLPVLKPNYRKKVSKTPEVLTMDPEVFSVLCILLTHHPHFPDKVTKASEVEKDAHS